MTAITQANVDTVSAIRVQTTEIMNKSVELGEFMTEVFNAVRQDKSYTGNIGKDWDTLAAAYAPEYTAKKAELIALLGALP
jgi:hypothetical protein